MVSHLVVQYSVPLYTLFIQYHSEGTLSCIPEQPLSSHVPVAKRELQDQAYM